MAAVEFLDITTRSSDWVATCPVHGEVTSLVVFGEDLVNRSRCAECLEAALDLAVSRVTITAKPGAPEPE